MKEIIFLGAAERVTGSRVLVTTNNGTMFGVDRGIFQGSNQTENDSLNLKSNDSIEPDLTIVTHAHLDHAGNAHQLKGPVLAHAATKSLMSINLTDAQKISPSHYPKGSVNSLMGRTKGVDYDVSTRVDGAVVTLRNAKHILGSASVEIEGQGEDRIVFSGDLGPRRSRTVSAGIPVKGADVVVIESTYGNENHSMDDPVEVFEDAINRTYRNHGVLIVPSFALDRTQGVLSIIKELRTKKKIRKNINIYLDAPMAYSVTREYINYLPLLSDELRAQKDPFGLQELIITNDWRDSMKIRNNRKSKVIIAGSGMMRRGRVERHALEYLSNPKNVLLLTGYCVEGTPGRAIIDGEKEVQFGNESVPIEATVLRIKGMSAHADQQGLFDWVWKIKQGDRNLRLVFVNHGEKEKSEALARLIEAELGVKTIIPKQGEIYNLQQNS